MPILTKGLGFKTSLLSPQESFTFHCLQEGNDPDAYAAAVKESADAVQGGAPNSRRFRDQKLKLFGSILVLFLLFLHLAWIFGLEFSGFKARLPDIELTDRDKKATSRDLLSLPCAWLRLVPKLSSLPSLRV